MFDVPEVLLSQEIPSEEVRVVVDFSVVLLVVELSEVEVVDVDTV